jgi:SAM-dependent methyltransferase
MDPKKLQTIATYNDSAQTLAEKFNGLGVRVEDIDETFALVKAENPNVLEIGCGNGRDAAEILMHTNRYRGMDVSEGLIAIARKEVPEGRFEVMDIEGYEFPPRLDAVFAFASLIHVPKESLREILRRMREALNEGGVVRISLKHSDPYSEVTKEDEFGTRTYFLYSKKDIEELAEGFSIIKNELNDLRGQVWLEILLQKKAVRD